MTDPLLPIRSDVSPRVHEIVTEASLRMGARFLGVPLDPRELAKARREDEHPGQLDWDQTRLAARMLSALVAERGADPAILLPPAKFMATATRLLEERGGELDPQILTGTLRSMARQIAKGSFGEACFFLRHAWGGIRAEGTSDEMMASLVREFFPVAPEGWGPVPQRRDERQANIENNRAVQRKLLGG